MSVVSEMQVLFTLMVLQKVVKCDVLFFYVFGTPSTLSGFFLYEQKRDFCEDVFKHRPMSESA